MLNMQKPAKHSVKKIAEQSDRWCLNLRWIDGWRDGGRDGRMADWLAGWMDRVSPVIYAI